MCVNSCAANIDSEKLRKLRDKAAEIECSLKAISAANQAERKRLATAHHTSLTQQSQSQLDVSAEAVTVMEGDSQSIRQQLLSLATRQKRLLQCFRTQKEVTERLGRLSEQCKSQTIDVVSGLGSRGLEGEKRQGGLGAGPAKSSRLSAAIPNLSQHLRPPLQQSLVSQTTQSRSKFNVATSQHSRQPPLTVTGAQATPATSTHVQQPPSSISTASAPPTSSQMAQHLPQSLVQPAQVVLPSQVTLSSSSDQTGTVPVSVQQIVHVPRPQQPMTAQPPSLARTLPHVPSLSSLSQAQPTAQTQGLSQVLHVHNIIYM